MHHIRNANGSHARDPITLNKIRVENAYYLSGKPYDRKSLEKWVEARHKNGLEPTVPHTGLPMKQVHIKHLTPKRSYRQHAMSALYGVSAYLRKVSDPSRHYNDYWGH